MKKWLNYLPTIFIITIVFSLFMYSTQGSVNHMNYTQFQQAAQDATFKNATIDIQDTVLKVEGTYTKDGKPTSFNVIIPNTEENLEWVSDQVREDGGTVTITDPDSGALWATILGQLLPLGLIAVFFYFMFAHMGGGGNNKAFEFAKSKARVETNVKTRFKDFAG